MVITNYLLDDMQTANRRAALTAALPDVRCVAIVDLYSQDDPLLVGWMHDVGGGPHAAQEPPFPELLDGLRDFVHQLQAAAE